MAEERAYELHCMRLLRAVDYRLQHVLDECPKRNVIFEIEADLSENVLIKIVRKLCATSPHIDVLIYADQHRSHLVEQLKNALKDVHSVLSLSSYSLIRGVHHYKIRRVARESEYAVTVSTIDYFLKSDLERSINSEPKKESAVVLYRMEDYLDGRSLVDAVPVRTRDVNIAPILLYIHRMVDVMDEERLLLRMRALRKRHADLFIDRFLNENMHQLIISAKSARRLIHGADFAFLTIDGKPSLVVASAISQQLGMQQFLELRHCLPVTALRLPLLFRTPLHWLKSYTKVMGVFRRGFYELRDWLPFITQLEVFVARVYNYDQPMARIMSIPPSTSTYQWIVQMEKVMTTKELRQSGVRLVVCPTTAAMHLLRKLFMYSHDERMQAIRLFVCTSEENVEKTVNGLEKGSLVVILTTVVHFQSWHSPFICCSHDVAVLLGAPSRDVQYLQRAHRLARPIANVIMIPLNKEDEPVVGFVPLRRHVQNRSQWTEIFAKEMMDRGINWKAEIKNEEDEKYERTVERMRSVFKACS